MHSESNSHIDFFVQHGESGRLSLVHGLVDACTASLSPPESGPRRCWRFYTGLRDVLETSTVYVDGLVNTHPDFFTASLRYVTSPLGPTNHYCNRLKEVGKAAALCTCPNDGNLWAHQPFEEGEIIDDPVDCAEKVYGALIWISLAGISDITVKSDGTFTFGSRETCFKYMEERAKEQFALTGNMPWPRNRRDILVNSPYDVVDALWHCFRKFNTINRAHSLSLLWYFLCGDENRDYSRHLGHIPEFPTVAIEQIQLAIDYHTKDGWKAPRESETYPDNFLTIIRMSSEIVQSIIFAWDKRTAYAMKAIWSDHAMDIVQVLSYCAEVYRNYGRRAEGHAWLKAHEEKAFEDTSDKIVAGLYHLKLLF